MDLSSIPTSTAQAALGAEEGSAAVETVVDQTVYNGSEICPGCGELMNPIQVMYGYGLCPTCQAVKNAKIVKELANGQR